MTVFDVKQAILGYGYSRDLANNDELFYTVLNLSIQEINRLRPRTERLVIAHEPVKAIATYPDTTLIKQEEPVTHTVKARSVSFEVSGTGAVEVTAEKKVEDKYVPVDAWLDGDTNKTRDNWTQLNGWRRITVTAAEDAYISLKLTTNDTSTVGYIRSLAFYDVAVISHLPSDKTVTYDLALMQERFARVVLPIMKDGVELSSSAYSLYGNRLSIPVDATGTYEVTCEVFPARVSEADDHTTIPLDADLAELLPLLVASQVWIDDEPEKALLYEKRYQRAAAMIRPTERVTHFTDRRGWT